METLKLLFSKMSDAYLDFCLKTHFMILEMQEENQKSMQEAKELLKKKK